MKRFLLSFLMVVASVSFATAQGIQPCYTTNGTNCIAVSPVNPLPVMESGQVYKNVVTNGDTNVKASPGVFYGLIVNTAGTNSTATVYDDADGTCNSNSVGTFTTVSQVVLNLSLRLSNGLCVKTAGDVAADITILYR